MRDDPLTPDGEPPGGHTAPMLKGVLAPPLGGPVIERLDCLSCHAPHPNGQPHQIRAPGRAAWREGDAPFDPVTNLCLSCHPVAAQFRGIAGRFARHPVGIVVRRRPAMAGLGAPALPLVDRRGTPASDDGLISCTTCHFPHATANPFLLRWPQKEAKAACSSCHPGGDRTDDRRSGEVGFVTP